MLLCISTEPSGNARSALAMCSPQAAFSWGNSRLCDDIYIDLRQIPHDVSSGVYSNAAPLPADGRKLNVVPISAGKTFGVDSEQPRLLKLRDIEQYLSPSQPPPILYSGYFSYFLDLYVLVNDILTLTHH
ncbi:predicted protein [Histoplasma capsulatum var. duboisii H88]|uniref:Predicted protein n=1 Tax=Ajellomyces capsulatus (strain H88) TaxID=544711 RepID=F0ULB1_AJEC8|nr:predicted protein [Histoplasma capsulatum var. duboisii H88]